MIKSSTIIAAFLLTFFNFFSVQAQNPCSAQFTWIDSVASGTHYLFLNASSPNFLSQYTWTVYGSGASQTQSGSSAIYQNISPGTYYVCLSVVDSSFGCQNSNCDTITIGSTTGGCQAYFTHTINPNGLASFSNGSTGSGLSYAWDFGDGSTSNQANPTHVYTTAGTYTACLTVSNGSCSDTYCKTITFGSTGSCNANFTLYDSSGTGYVYAQNYSTPSNATFTWYVYLPNGQMTTYNGYQPVFNLSNVTGTVGVCLYVQTSNCFDSTCSSITLNNSGGNCSAGFYAFDSTFSGSIYTYNTSSVSSNATYAWTISGPNGYSNTSNLFEPIFQTPGAGTYTICLAVTDGSCSDNYCQTVTLGGTSNCTADFFAYDSTSAGTFNNLIYTYNYSNGSANATYAWTISGPNNFGYTTTGLHPIFQTPGAGTYVICMTMTDGSCVDSTCQSFTLGNTSGCQAYYTWSISNNTIYAVNQSQTTGVYTSSWTLSSNGMVVANSTSQNPNFPVQAGSYQLCLTVSDSSGCSDTYCQNFSVGTPSGVVTVTGNGMTYTFNLNSGFTIHCNSFGNMPITPGTVLCITSNVPIIFVSPQNDTLYLDSCYVAMGCDSLGNVILTNANGQTVIIPAGSTGSFAPRYGLTGTEKMQISQVSVYPNPNQGEFNIRTNEQMKKVVVYQLTGTKVFEQQVNGLDAQLKLPNVASGLYILEVETESGIGRSRIQIQ